MCSMQLCVLRAQSWIADFEMSFCGRDRDVFAPNLRPQPHARFELCWRHQMKWIQLCLSLSYYLETSGRHRQGCQRQGCRIEFRGIARFTRSLNETSENAWAAKSKLLHISKIIQPDRLKVLLFNYFVSTVWLVWLVFFSFLCLLVSRCECVKNKIYFHSKIKLNRLHAGWCWVSHTWVLESDPPWKKVRNWVAL